MTGPVGGVNNVNPQVQPGALPEVQQPAQQPVQQAPAAHEAAPAQAQAAPEQAGAANQAEELPELLQMSKAKRVLMGIFSFGLSELIVSECKMVHAAKLHALQPALREQDKAKADRANGKFRAALEGTGRLPSKYEAAKQEAFASVKQRFGENAVSAGVFEKGEKLANKALLKFMDNATHAVKKSEALRIYESSFAKAHVEELAKARCQEKMQALEQPGAGFVNENMAQQVIRHSDEMARKIESVQSPEDVAGLMQDIDAGIDAELGNRQLFDETVKKMQEGFVKQLMAFYGMDEQLATELVGSVRFEMSEVAALNSAEDLPEVQRDAGSGQLTNAQAIVDQIKHDFKVAMKGRVAALVRVKQLKLADGPAKIAMQKAAFSQTGIRKPEVVTLLSGAVKGLDLADLVTALTAQPPKASDIAKAMQPLQERVSEYLVAGAAEMELGDMSEADWSALYESAVTLIFNSAPELARLAGSHPEEMVQAASQLASKAAEEGASFVQAFVKNPWMPSVNVRWQRQLESAQLAKSLQGDEMPQEILDSVFKRQQELCRQFGPEGLYNEKGEIQNSAAWKGVVAELQSRIDEGRTISADDVLKTYEIHAVRQMMTPKIQAIADEAAREIGMTNPANMKAFVSSDMMQKKFKALKSRQEVAALLESVKTFVRGEVKLQKTILDECARLQGAAVAALKAQLANMSDEAISQLAVVKEYRQQVDAAVKELLEKGGEYDQAFAAKLEGISNNIVKPCIDVLKPIAASGLPADVKQILQEAALQGKAFDKPEQVAAFKKSVDGLKAAVNEAMKSLKEPEKCIDALGAALTTAMAELNSSLGDGLDEKGRRVLYGALIGSVLEEGNPVGRMMDENEDEAAQLLVTLTSRRDKDQRNLTLDDERVGGENLKPELAAELAAKEGVRAERALMNRIVLDFVQQAASQDVADHVADIVDQMKLLKQVNLGKPDAVLTSAIRTQLTMMNLQLGDALVPEDTWQITRSDVWDRLKKRVLEPDMHLTTATIALEYAKQARLVLFENEMTSRMEAYVNRRMRNEQDFKILGTVKDLVHAVTERLTNLNLEDGLHIRDLLPIFEQEAEDQCVISRRSLLVKEAVVTSFQEATGMDRAEVQARLNLTGVDQAVQQIYASAERKGRPVDGVPAGVGGGLMNRDDLMATRKAVEALPATFGAECKAFVKAVKEDPELSDGMKGFLVKMALRHPTFGKYPELLPQLKTALKAVDDRAARKLAAIVREDGDDVGKAFVDQLAKVFEPVAAKFDEVAGSKMDKNELLIAHHCLAKFYLDTHLTLQGALRRHPGVVLKAQTALSASEELKAPEKAGVVKMCERFFNLTSVKELTQKAYGFEIISAP